MKVLVGITTRNRQLILPRAIASALEQKYAPKEVAVIDDASQGNPQMLARTHPGVRWIFNSTPQGLRNNRNRLMQEAVADFFVSLDDDAWFLQKDEIQVAVEEMCRNPHLAAIAFDILSPDQPHPRERTHSKPVAAFIGCGHLLRLSSVREVGWYSDLPGDYGAEESDLCLRLLERGYEIVCLPGVHVWHQKEWSHRDWFGTHASGVCNDLAMAVMRCPFPDLLWVLPAKLVNQFRFACRTPRFFKSGLSGISRFLVRLPACWRRREAVSKVAYREFIRRSQAI